jgi:ABC-type phosphate/phosphonate transport system substrate-binding protein
VDRDLYLSLEGSQDAVIRAVYRGKVAAGFLREDALSQGRGGIELTTLNIIAYTDYFPTWSVAAFRNTPPEVAAKITKALLELDLKKSEGREMLETIGIAGFAQAADLDYNIMRQVMDALNIPY